MKNETEKSVLLSCGVFCFRIRASYDVTSPFRLTLGRDFSFPEKTSQAQEQFGFFALFLIRRERKIKVLSFRGFKNEGVFLYVVKDIRSGNVKKSAVEKHTKNEICR